MPAWLTQFAFWVYAPAAAFLLLTLSERFSGVYGLRILKPIGARSLEIYLVHPMVIWALDRTVPENRGFWEAWPIWPLYFIACLFAPMGLAYLARRLRLSRILFGTG